MTINAKKIVKIAGLSAFFLIIVIFAFFRSSDLIFGVKIKNVVFMEGTPARTTVQSGGKVADSIMKVEGSAKNAVSLALNGRIISINQKGDFSETIALLSGYNIINIRAQDKFGYVDEKNYQIIK
jgi:hypothetical protein